MSSAENFRVGELAASGGHSLLADSSGVVAVMNDIPPCAVCGGLEYRHQDVLWQGLIADWGLSKEETAYVNRQQGTQCTSCGSNIRSIALANALCRSFGHRGVLDELIGRRPVERLLEVNEAGSLHSRLQKFPGYAFASYPEYDLMDLALEDGSYEFIVHSDTLEHVPDPVRALTEIRRVLRPGGRTVFTVPIVIGRMTRSRDGLPSSYHGDAAMEAADQVVHTEFGADAWTMVLKAGFSSCELVPFDYPAGIAISAVR